MSKDKITPAQELYNIIDNANFVGKWDALRLINHIRVKGSEKEPRIVPAENTDKK